MGCIISDTPHSLVYKYTWFSSNYPSAAKTSISRFSCATSLYLLTISFMKLMKSGCGLSTVLEYSG